MERKVGTISRGIRCPIIREGDDLVEIAVNSVLEAAESEGYEIRNRDVVALTESIVARAQGNYASVDAIAKDVRAKLGGETVGVIFPILSRNRFAICLRGIARGCKKVVLMLSYPSDEVGNELIDKLGHSMSFRADIVKPFVFAKLSFGNIEVCKDQGQRSFQLMVCIGDELLLLFIAFGNGFYRFF